MTIMRRITVFVILGLVAIVATTMFLPRYKIVGADFLIPFAEAMIAFATLEFSNPVEVVAVSSSRTLRGSKGSEVHASSHLYSAPGKVSFLVRLLKDQGGAFVLYARFDLSRTYS
jgi:hypothetical protein